MTKERSQKRESKKVAAMSMMEKRDAKRAKKVGKLNTFSLQPTR
jgi:hypothetical protein